jgi:hypothetical protein
MEAVANLILTEFDSIGVAGAAVHCAHRTSQR